MGGTIAEQREALQAELERLESLLALNANWQALRLLKGRTSVPSATDPGAAMEQARLESALERNPVFRQRKLIVEALAAIGTLAPETGLKGLDAEPAADLPEVPPPAPRRIVLAAGTEASGRAHSGGAAETAGSPVASDAFAVEPSPPPSSAPPMLKPAEATVEAAPVPIRGRKRAGRRAAKDTQPSPKPGSLLSRLRQVRPQSQFDSAGYAAYHSEIEEATVEIIRRDKGRD